MRLVAALVTAGLFAHPAMSAALPGQEAPPGTDDGGYSADAAGAPGAGQVDIDTDPLKGSSEDLDETLSTLGENLDEQLGELESARNALAETDAQLGDIRDAIEVTEGEIAELESQSDDVVIEAFINPPTEDSLDTLTADSLSEATIKQSILDTQADANADVLGDLAAAREELEEQEAAESELEDAAEEARDSQEQELIDLQGAQSQQALFVAQVQLRLDKNLSEAEALKDVMQAMRQHRRANLITFRDQWRRRVLNDLETVEADSDMRLICGDCAGRGAGHLVPPAVREIFFRVQRITPAEFTRGVAADADAISDLSGRLRRLITAAIGHDKPFEREGRMRTEAGK